jgi:oligopeptide transport system ATP-binding protein
MSMRSPPLLRVNDLTVDFHADGGVSRVVDRVSFEVGAGEAVGIIGESGCGKSQMVLAMLGLLDRSGRAQGSVRYRGQELIGRTRRALNRIRGAKVAMIFQDPMSALNPHLKIETQLVEVLHRHAALNARVARKRAIDMLTAVRMPDAAQCLRRFPHELSGGQRQRVMIAMSLLCKPEVLIADEPTTALDVTVQAEILQLLHELKRDSAMALIFITHDMGVVAGLCERVLVMYAGRVVESGPTEAVFNRPRHPYTQGLLACVPRLYAPPDAPLFAIPGQPPAPGMHTVGCSFSPRCPHVFARCLQEKPALISAAGEHAKACHLDLFS